VAEATPLSRFLIEAAREGCELSTAEGRAHMASNARPLWSALPEGALKRQLLAEIAALAQLGTQELGDLWAPAAPRAPAAAQARSAPASSEMTEEDWASRDQWFDEQARSAPEKKRFKSSFRQPPAPPRPPPGGRRLPTSRADVAARLVLSNPAEWEALSHELHALLCDLPGEHGQLFAWLDSQSHEHGTQPWAALREGLRGLDFEPLAVRVMTGPDGGPIGDAEGEQAADSARELRNVLDYMLDDLLKAQQSEAIAAVGSDPRALERYKALEARRLELRNRLKPSANSACKTSSAL
jgi:DNA primase